MSKSTLFLPSTPRLAFFAAWTAAVIGPVGHVPNSMAQTTELPEVVVTASRTPLALDKVGSTVEVIEEEELEKHARSYLKDYLEQLPGISFAQSGPPGTIETIRLRGAGKQYIKVLIDGIDISDPSAPQTAVSFEHLLVGDIARIEVLKGSQSTLYGGDAVAGVIAITTKGAATDGFSLRANAETGTYKTKRGSATLSYGGSKGDIAVTAQGFQTDGFSAADENAGNTESDGYENLTFSGRGRFAVTDNFSLFFAARSLYSDGEFDDFSFLTGLPVDDTAGNHTKTRQNAGRIGAEMTLFDGLFENKISAQTMAIKRDTFGSFPSTYEGDRLKFAYQGLLKLHERASVMFGAERDQTGAVSNADPVRRTARIDGLYMQAMIEPLDNVNITAGLRRDDHDTFGTFDTYRLTGAWFLPQTETKFHASYGTGFRAPSLFELFSPLYGNQNLTPEESISWDAGIDQAFLDGALKLSASYFSLNTQNLIQFVFPAGYTNVAGVTRRSGVELSAHARLADWATVKAAYTYTDARDDDGNRLVRAPRHILALGSEVRPTDRLALNVTAKIVQDTVDSNDVVLDDYVLLNAKLSYEINDQLSAYVRGENLLNQEYQTVNGYGTSDLAIYGGLQVKLGGQ